MKKHAIGSLTLVLAVSMVLASCSSKDNTEASTTTNTSNSTSTQATNDSASKTGDTAATADNSGTTTADTGSSADSDQQNWFGGYDSAVKVNVAVPSNAAETFPDGWSYKKNVWTESFQSDLNVNVNVLWDAVNANGDYTTKLNLALASKDLPDIIQFDNQSQFQQAVQAGLVQDLTNVYDKYASPRLKHDLTADGSSMSWGNVNGKLLGIPVGGVNYPTARMVLIRNDWFKDTGLPAPKTMEDVIAIAKAMKAKDPKVRYDFQLGDQIVKDGMSGIIGMANAFGGYPGIWVSDGNGGLEYGSIQPQVKDALQVYADIYKGGGINPAFTTYDGNALAQQLTAGNVGVAISEVWLPSWPLNALYSSDGVDWDIYPILPSSTLTTPVKAQIDSPSGRVFAVKAGYDHPEVLFKLLNYQVAKTDDPATTTNDTLLKYSGDADGKYNYLMMDPLAAMGGVGDPTKNFDTQKNVTAAVDSKDSSKLTNPSDLLQYGYLDDYVKKTAAGTKPSDADWVAYKTWYGPNSGYGILNQYFDKSSYIIDGLNGYMTPTMLKQWSSLTDLENQYFMQIITGQRPVSDFDAFVSAWKAGGGDIITKEVDEYMKSKQ